jgi:hypothetical protein
MTEQQWLACIEPLPMLEFVRDSNLACERKLRLFAASCCRRAWHRLDANGRAALEVSERFADGLADDAELQAAVWASRGELDINARAAVDSAAVGAWRLVVPLLAEVCGPADAGVQADLLRCVIGPLPFRSPSIDPCWRTPVVHSLAQAAYEERMAPDPGHPGWLTLDPDSLAVLADALEEAGCTDAELLAHLRRPGPHVRGCWAVDCLTG